VNINLQHVPFSRYGSYLACSYLAGAGSRPEGLYLRTLHRNALRYEILRIELISQGHSLPYQLETTPECLALEGGSGRLELCIAGEDLVRLRCRGVAARLVIDASTFDYAMPAGEGCWEVNSFQTRRKYRLTPLEGRLQVDAPWRETRADHVAIDLLPDEASNSAECALEAFESTWKRQVYEQSFEACVAEARDEFQRWLDRTVAAPERYAEAHQMAAYINWSCVVNPAGYLTRPAMLMSKNWMTNVWSWDHCFNAMALVYSNPELAWDQLMLMVDNQDVHGAFPDSINDADIVWNFCKPPIHGWALRFMLRRSRWITPQRLEEIYAPLCRWTDWWLDCRDADGDGIPQYHHGNDSGWDNCTAFEVGPPVESADLSAYLIIQMDVLAEVARLMGREDEALSWQRRADALLERLLAHSWRGDRFVAPRSGDHAVFESDTLFHFLPLVLGERLPVTVREHLVAGLKEPGRFLTTYGLATESVRSPLYQPDGYWRGPIWAPSTLILIDGLAACGEHILAKDLARSFCDMAARSGMAENYDALRGEGLRDRAYTWTSSAFLILAHEYLRDLNEP
jgi:putative isomerase